MLAASKVYQNIHIEELGEYHLKLFLLMLFNHLKLLSFNHLQLLFLAFNHLKLLFLFNHLQL